MNILSVLFFYSAVFTVTTGVAFICEVLDSLMVWVNVFHTPTLYRHQGFQILLLILSMTTALLHMLCGNIFGFCGFFLAGLAQIEMVRRL